MRRPNFYAPLSVTFTTDRTGARIQQEHGAEGLGVWAAAIAAAKKNQGQIIFAHDSDWQALGIITPPSFTLRAFLKTTGAMKQTRTETHGHVMYVSLTHYGDWNDDAQRGRERERKTRTDIETNRKVAGNKPERNRKTSGHHSPQIVREDKSSKQRGVAGDLTQPLAAEARRLLEHLQSRGEPNLEPEPPL